MARVGRFGHLPAAAPDLSATIVAMMEQYEAQRDRNIQTAWEQGGQFEGQKVTDQQYLQFIQKRAGEISRDDPMYDYWMQSLFAVRFRIAESKANLQYQRENWDEGDMAAFYRREAQKVPRASQAWRDLMTSAARFAKADKARRSASNAAAKAEAFKRKWENAEKRWIKPAQVVDNALTRLAQRNGWISRGETFWSLNLGAGEVLSFNDALAQLEGTPGWDDVRAYLERNDPHFHGRLTMEYVGNTYERAKHGSRIQRRAAKDIGYSSYEEAAQQKIDGYDTQSNKAETWDTSVSYANARETWLDVIADPTATAAERAAADATYAKQLGRFENQFDKTGDIVSAGKMLNERRALAGDIENVGDDPLYSEDWAGLSTGESTQGKEIAARKAKDVEDLTALASGASVQVWGKDSETGAIVPQIVPAQEGPTQYGVDGAVSLVRSTRPSSMTTPDGKTISVPAATYSEYRQRTPVYVRTPNPLYVDPMTGDYTQMNYLNPSATQGEQVGWMMTDPLTGAKSWQMFTSQGSVFTDLDPFQTGAVKRQYMEDGSWIVIPDPNFTVEGGGAVTIPPQQPGEEPKVIADPRAVLRPQFRQGETLPGTPPPEEEAGAGEGEPIGPTGLSVEDWTVRRAELQRQIAEREQAVSTLPAPWPELPTTYGEQPEQPPPEERQDPDLVRLRQELTALEAEQPNIAVDRKVQAERLGTNFQRIDELQALIAERQRQGLGNQPDVLGAQQELAQLRATSGAGGMANVGVFNPIVRQSQINALLGVRPANQPAGSPEDEVAATVNESIGYSTYTTFYWSQDQQHRRDFLAMDPAAVVRTIQTQDPEVIAHPEKLEGVLREVDQIRTGALQGEAQYTAQTFLQGAAPWLGQDVIDTMAWKIGQVAPTRVVTSLMRQAGIPVAESEQERREAARAAQPATLTNPLGQWVNYGAPAGGREGVPTTGGEVAVPELPPTPPPVPGALAPQLTEAQRIQQAREARSVVAARPTARPIGRPITARPSAARPRIQQQVRVPDAPVIRLPPLAPWQPPETAATRRQREEEQRREQTVPRRGPVAS